MAGMALGEKHPPRSIVLLNRAIAVWKKQRQFPLH
jgi:hypothetical protein